MRSHIMKRKADLQEGHGEDANDRKDVLSMLVQANETDGNLKLDDSELVRDIYVRQKKSP
jgi:cytochrome P450